ncbi:flagellar protein FlgN [Sphingomonas sp.]|uniref:flagellar protein FlgN n=1 Tax=Sphingomonas sp. TaxID=28214 RepID=UPI001B1D8FA7|nr:flagellar protein FlgN [Sphingomonas sp.]MBO9713490.1 flagellar protein FlgN [Sphingomonas sp.]
MIDKLIDAMVSLTDLMDEETAKLSRGPWFPELPEIAEAKLRLTGRIDAEVARLRRESETWSEELTDEQREQLTEASRALRDASTLNADILARQIEISVDMMAAIAAEAQRLTGKRNKVYGSTGMVAGREDPAPISVNARL